MRVAELSRRTGVSVASIKYYLREGMLAPGVRTGPNQADYGEDHVRRLRLVRALLDTGGLSVAAAKGVLGAVDDDAVGLHDVLGLAQDAVTPAVKPQVDEATDRAERTVADLVARRGWDVAPKNPGWRAAVDVLSRLDRLDAGYLVERLELYAASMEDLARHEVGAAAQPSDRARSVEGAVTGIVLGGALLLAVRGMAQEDASARRLRGDAG